MARRRSDVVGDSLRTQEDLRCRSVTWQDEKKAKTFGIGLTEAVRLSETRPFACFVMGQARPRRLPWMLTGRREPTLHLAAVRRV